MIDVKSAPAEAPNVSRPSNRHRLAWGAGLVLAVAVLGGGAAYTGLPAWRESFQAKAQTAPAAPVAVPVSVAVVEQREAAVWHDYSGRTEAVGRVDIRPRVAGAIMSVHFREGALVKQGDLLFTIDPAPYAVEVRRVEAQMATAQALLVLSTREQNRAQQLVSSGAVAVRDLDQRSNNLRAAEASLRAAQAALESSRLSLSYTEVRAPISGRAGKVEVTPGNLVDAGMAAPVLTTLVSVDPIYASFEADEQTVSRALSSLPKNADASSGLGQVPVRMGTLGSDGTPFLGKLQLIDNVVDARSGTVRVRAEFANPDGRLMPGQFARLRLGQSNAESAIAVNEGAIGTDQDRRFVLVVGDDNKTAYRAVQLGGLSDGLRIVTGGLKPGERIVVNGLQRVRPGSLVAPQTVAMASPSLASR
jgi:multidrug efflux system membrane fusion protein